MGRGGVERVAVAAAGQGVGEPGWIVEVSIT